MRFAEAGHAELASPGEGDLVGARMLAAAIARRDLLVAAPAQRPVGFALCLPAREALHLKELDVLPEAGGRGIGSALVDAVCALARERGLARVTLTTFRDVPFNAPFYARRGFREPARPPAELAALLAAEADAGFDPAKRVAMVRELT